ncbi:MAG: DUF1697 domain-containing protein [Caulobacterales bacterium]
MAVGPHVALLRSVNVGGRNAIAMSQLRSLAEGLGYARVRTLLQSGNLLFDAESGAVDLEQALERELDRRLGLATEVLVRAAGEWDAVVAANPFPDAAERDPSHLVLLALKGEADEARVAALQAAVRDREQVRGAGRQVYAYYPDGIGRSRLTMGVIERALGARATGRNWNTVLKLAQALRDEA